MLSFELGTILEEANVILYHGPCTSTNNNIIIIIKLHLETKEKTDSGTTVP
jgi:hypothetical protein